MDVHEIEIQEHAASIEREKVLQRFEDENGDDLLNDDGTIISVFDRDTWSSEMEEEEKFLCNVFDELVEQRRTKEEGESADKDKDKKKRKKTKRKFGYQDETKNTLDRSNASRFFCRVGNQRFFVKGNKPSALKSDDVRELLRLCLPTSDMRYTYDSLSAACYAWRFTSVAQLPGEDPYDGELEKELKMSKEEEFNFRVAFSIIADKDTCSLDDAISEDDLADVFYAIGYTVQDSDVEALRNLCEISDDGMILVDSALQAYESWRDDQLQLKTLKAVFNTLIADKHIHRNIPDAYKNKVVGRTELDIHAMREVLNSVGGASGAEKMSKDEVFDIVGELSSKVGRSVSLQDFIRLFNTHYRQKEREHS